MAGSQTTTVNISFRKDLLDRIDELAAQESRSRSELIREAARAYIDSKSRWRAIFELTRRQAARAGLSPQNVEEEIAAFRDEKRRHR
jgi:metal-responsive CopG/Arc/MetJ family transcriptional regulator